MWNSQRSAKINYMDCVRVLIAHNCPKDKGTTLQDPIAKINYMDCVRVLIAYNCPKDKGTTLWDPVKHSGQTDKSKMDSVKVWGPI